MSLTRKMLEAMGIEDAQAEQIMIAHGDDLDQLVKERDKLRERVKETDSLRKQLEESKASDSDFAKKYEAEHRAFEDFKAGVEKDKAEAEKRGLYEALLRDCGIDEKRIRSVLKVTDLSQVEVKDGALDKAEELAKSVKEEWSDFIATEGKHGAPVSNPPKVEQGSNPQDLNAALCEYYGL